MNGKIRGMDVAVLGGGPAGLAAALALRQRGCRVALYDGQYPPIDKACGEGLMPEAVRLLEGLGLSLGESDGAALKGICFHDAETSAYSKFRSGRGLGIRRTHLQAKMAALAVRMGVALHWGTTVRAVAAGEFVTGNVPIRAGFTVIADGLCSTLAAAAGFREGRRYRERFASRQQFRCAPWSEYVEVHWRNGEQLYVTPLGDGEVGAVLLTGTCGRRISDALRDFPKVAHRLTGAAPVYSMRGAVTRTRTLRQVLRGNVAVLGDASGSVDAITGEGLLSAFRQAYALAEALDRGKPEAYAAAHRKIARNPHRMAQLLLLLDRRAALREGAFRTLAKRPEIFDGLLRVHLGEQAWLSFAWGQVRSLLARRGDSEHYGSPFAVNVHRERGL